MPSLGMAQPARSCSASRRGSSAGLHRQVLYGGLRIGMYEPVKRIFMGTANSDKCASPCAPRLAVATALHS